MNNLDFLTIFDTVILVLNILFIYLFLKKEKFYFINLIISVNAIRLFYSYLVFDNVWWLRHSLAIALLLLINLLDTKKIMHFIFSTDKLLRFLIIFFFLVFTFKENFMVIHPGIGGWTYEYSTDFMKNNTYENIENSEVNLILKNKIIEQMPKTKINGFNNGYMYNYNLSVAETNIGDFIFNDGDYHFVFSHVIFNRIENDQKLLSIQKNILEKTLCHRINGKRFLINRTFSYPDHTPYFKIDLIEKNCNKELEVYNIKSYKVYSNIVNNNLEIKKVEIQN